MSHFGRGGPGSEVRMTQAQERDSGIPEGLWTRCPERGDMLFRKGVEEALHVCPNCQYHFRVGARTRNKLPVDPGSFEERYADVEPAGPLRLPDHKADKDSQTC